MRKLAIGAVMLALMGVWGGTALAQFQQPIGDIYLSFDNSKLPDKGLEGRYKTVGAGTQFNFFIMFHVDFGEPPYNNPGMNATDGATAWEGAITVPSSIIVISRTLPPGHTDFGNGDDNWIVGTGGQCVNGASTPFVMVTYLALTLTPVSDVRINLLPATPTTFNLDPRPGFLGCPVTAGTLYPAKDRWQGNWITLNCTASCVLPGEQQTWGALKSSYSQQ